MLCLSQCGSLEVTQLYNALAGPKGVDINGVAAWLSNTFGTVLLLASITKGRVTISQSLVCRLYCFLVVQCQPMVQFEGSSSLRIEF